MSSELKRINKILTKNIRQTAARELQQLQFQKICATLEGVRMAVQLQARGLVSVYQKLYRNTYID